jgi:uncharacterized membrane protein
MLKVRGSVPQRDTARIEAFSDGVFAIAITLLILEVKVPAPPTPGQSFNLLWTLSLWPSYLAYTLVLALYVRDPANQKRATIFYTFGLLLPSSFTNVVLCRLGVPSNRPAAASRICAPSDSPIPRVGGA